jgi:DUF1009 family protein
VTEAPIGLIAGNQDLPKYAARKIRSEGIPLCAVGLIGETDPEIRDLSDFYLEVPLGGLQAMADFFLTNGAVKICMAGGVSRERVVAGYQPDEAALELMAGLDNFHTDAILRALAGWLEAKGLNLVSVAELVPDLAVSPGLLTELPPTKSLLADLKLAYSVAKELGRLDVGQTVVASDKIVVALEGADGTDATIKRGAALCRKPVAVAKVVKPLQDVRLDPPVVGPETFSVLADCRAGALALDARGLIFLEREKCLSIANSVGLSVVAWLNDADAPCAS